MECAREQEAMQATSCGRWPDRCPEDLRLHIAECDVCSDAVEVSMAFRDDLESLGSDVHVPAAGVVWWRAELRARQDATRKASRPITLVQAFGGACSAGVAVALLSRAWPALKDTLTLIDVSTLSPLQWTLVIAVAVALLVIGPLAMYLVLSDE
jgi:hypothetical protein